MRLLFLPAASAATVLALAAPASAQSPPTLAFERACHTEGDLMAFTGSGFTPARPVDLVLPLRPGIAVLETVAGPAGEITGAPPVPSLEDVLAEEEFATDVVVTANDRTRIAAQPPGDPTLQVATASTRISRRGVWMTRRKIAAAKPIGIKVAGLALDVGETVYAHYRRGGRTVKRLRLGRLAGPCGDLEAFLRRGAPASLAPGRYQVLLSTSRGDPRAGSWITLQTIRVRATAAGAGASPAAAQRAASRPVASAAARSRWASPADGNAVMRHFHAPAAVPG
jgi:hypothetical protein